MMEPGLPVLIRKPQPEDLTAGWDGAGWYYYDDDGDLHGPFATIQDCASGRRYYLEDTYDDGGIF